MIPYGRQSIDREDIKAVIDVLKSDFLTCGPKIEEFEKKFAKYVGSKYAIAVSNGTAGLHLACLAGGLKKGDELITSPMTFCASANCALYCQAKPVFVDINEQGLIDENLIEKKITKKTKIIISVHYSGLPCKLDKIKKLAKKHNLIIIEDACHALGAKYKNSKIGDCQYSDMAVFSFHPVKHITTGEGGMITTNSKKLYEKLLVLRTHGITKNPEKFINHHSPITNHPACISYLPEIATLNALQAGAESIAGRQSPWYHEMQILGYNYRLTDMQCALGISQLKKINRFIKRRREIARKYGQAFKNNKSIQIIKESKDQFNSYHLYPIKVKDGKTRLKLFNYLKSKNIFCQVHYISVYWHPYYQKLNYKKGLCLKAEDFYKREISIPMHFSLTNKEQDFVIKSILGFFNICCLKKELI